MSATKALWNSVIKYATDVRSNGIDGYMAWQSLKKILGEIETPGITWNSDCLKLYQFMRAGDDSEPKEDRTLQTKVFGDDDDPKDATWEPHHFLLQHGRIPNNARNGFALYRLAQVAYNRGQYLAELKAGGTQYTDDMQEFYKTRKLQDITTYLTQRDIEKLDRILNTPKAQSVLEHAKHAMQQVMDEAMGRGSEAPSSAEGKEDVEEEEEDDEDDEEPVAQDGGAQIGGVYESYLRAKSDYMDM